MIGLDTNLVVRVLTNDDGHQAKRAADFMANNALYLPVTVLLECEWVLRHAYNIERSAIVDAFRRLLGLPNLKVESPAVVAQALSWQEAGLDFADALHLAMSRQAGAQAFVTFDRSLVNKAARMDTIDIVVP